MKKETFFEGLKDIFEIDNDLEESTHLHLTSLSTLALIAYLDKNFKTRIKVAQISNINTVSDLMKLIGEDNFE